MAALIIMGVLFILVAIAVLVGGAVAVIKQAGKSARGAPATGKVVDLVKRVFNPGSAGVYCPVVEFTTATRQTVRFESDFGTMPASHQPGQSLSVTYDPENPQKAEVDSASARWLLPGIMIAMGLLFLVLGGILLLLGILVVSAQK